MMTDVSQLDRDQRRKKSARQDSAQRLALGRLAAMLKVLSHPQRLRIVQELVRQERNVGELQSRLGIAPSGVSQHLGLLRAYGLVVDRRAGRLVYYRLAHEGLAPWLAGALDLLQGDPTALRFDHDQGSSLDELCRRPKSQQHSSPET